MSNRILTAGPFSMIYQNGFIRRVSHGDNEILRMIYFALRDEHWGTYHLYIEDEEINSSDDKFSIEYRAYNNKNEQRIVDWHATIVGESNGTITFELEGKVLQDTLKNRAGFCVLHPLKQIAGADCTVTHIDGRETQGKFPRYVAAENPFVDISEMAWKSGSLNLHLKFEGDIFETEDQRNWTDASFKTFCTPLSIPFPAMIQQGQTISQKVTFSVGQIQGTEITRNEFITLTESETTIPIPAIGIGSSSAVKTITPGIARELNDIKFSHYRIELDCLQTDWQSVLQNEIQNTKILQLPLEIVFHTTQNYKSEIAVLLESVKKPPMPVTEILFLTTGALVTSQGLIDHITEIKNQFGNIRLGAGTNFNFTEINQNRFNPLSLDFISFSIDPQEHSFDDMSVLENIEAQGHVTESAMKIYPGKKIHVSPVTLRKRNNPYTKDPKAVVMSEEQRADPRQSANFCAVFTLGSIKALSKANCARVTYYQTAGKQGIMSVDGKVFPVCAALKSILNGGSRFNDVTSSSPLDVDAMIIFDRGRKNLLAWNYTAEERRANFHQQTLSIPPMEMIVVRLQ